MITEWQLKGFKSFPVQTNIPLGAVTLFAGANSSGKSSVIQSILLVAQTLSSPLQSRTVILNGQLVRLGTFSDLASHYGKTEEIGIGFSLLIRDHLSRGVSVHEVRPVGRIPRTSRRVAQDEVSYHFVFAPGAAGLANTEHGELHPALLRGALEASGIGQEKVYLRFQRSSTLLADKAKRLGIEVAEAGEDLLQYDVQMEGADVEAADSLPRSLESSRLAGCVIQGCLPSAVGYAIDLRSRRASAVIEALLGHRRHRVAALAGRRARWAPEVTRKLTQIMLEAATASGLTGEPLATYPPALRYLLAEESHAREDPLLWLEKLSSLPVELRTRIATNLIARHDEVAQALGQTGSPDYELQAAPLPEPFDEVASAVRQYFSRNVRYLGPLRDEPRALYPLATTSDPTDVGLRGEHTAAVLELHRKKVISYVPPTVFQRPGLAREQANAPLEKAVEVWLQYLGIADAVNASERGGLGYELRVRTSGSKKSHALTHVGVGVSQVLPILVMALIAPSGGTLLFEQPELHLHPAVQGRLADFFVSLAMRGTQCLVETHSEYLVNRIRVRIASPGGEQVRRLTRVYFVDRLPDGSVFRSVSINDFGAIEDWPVGFFDQGQREAEDLLRAAVDRRKRERGGWHG